MLRVEKNISKDAWISSNYLCWLVRSDFYAKSHICMISTEGADFQSVVEIICTWCLITALLQIKRSSFLLTSVLLGPVLWSDQHWHSCTGFQCAVRHWLLQPLGPFHSLHLPWSGLLWVSSLGKWLMFIGGSGGGKNRLFKMSITMLISTVENDETCSD